MDALREEACLRNDVISRGGKDGPSLREDKPKP